MKVERINHLVLTVTDIETTCDFYHDLLGMEVETFSIRGKSLKFGNQKISLREKRREFEETFKSCFGRCVIQFLLESSSFRRVCIFFVTPTKGSTSHLNSRSLFNFHFSSV